MKTAVSIVFFLLLSLTANISFSAQPQQPAAPLEKVSLQLKWFHQFQFAGYYAAKELGYYEKEGLDVQILERSGNIDTVMEVVSGQVDFAVGDSGILTYYAKGQPIVALAAIFQHNPLVFIAKQSSGIMSPYEMRGKRIMLDTVGAGSASLRAMLAEASLDEKSYTTIKQSFRNDDLIEDKFDVMLAYLSDQPFYFHQKKLNINIINPQSFGIDFYGDILFTSQNELAKHPGRAEKFRRASLKGWQYALDHPEQIIQLIHDKYHSKLPLEHLRFEADITRKLIVPDLIPLGQMEVRRLKKVTEVYAQLKISKALSEDELAKFIYASNDLNLTAQERVWLKAHPVIRLGVDRDFAPYEWLDAHGNYLGLAADYIAVLERILGVKFAVVKDKPWNEVLEMAQHQQLDMLACVVKTPERSQYLNFTNPFISNPVIIINDSRHGFIGSLDRLNGKQVAIEKGYFMQELLSLEHPEIQLLPVDSVNDALTKVATGKAEAYIGDAASATHAIQELGLLNLGFAGETPYYSSHGMAIVKNNPELTSIITKALGTISIAEQERIKHHWLSLPVSPGIKPATLIKYGLGVLLILTLFAGWNFRLRKEVKARKQAKALAVKERKLAQQYLDVAGVMLVALNTAGEIILINRKGCEILGYAESELLHQNWFFLCIHQDDQPHALKRFAQLLTGDLEGSQSCETVIVTKTGKLRVIAFHQNVFRNSSAEITGLLSSGEDITERKANEQQLRTLSVAVEQSPASVVITDLAANLLYVNPKFTQVTGYSFEEAIGKNPRVLQSGLTPDETYLQMWNSLRQGQTWHGELINRRKNGEIYWEDAYLAPVKDMSGQITHYAGVKIDITQRKQAERQLKESEERLNLSQEYGGIGSWEWDLISHRQVWSHAVYEFLGFPEIANPTWDDFLAIVHPEDKEAVIAAHQNHLIQGQKYDIEYRATLSDGQLHWLRSAGQAQFAPDGTPVKFIGIVQDISERKHNELELFFSNNRFTALIEAIPDAIFFKDGDSRWLITNEAAKQLFLLHDIPWQGKTEMELAQMRPEFRAAHEACLIDDEKTWEAGHLMMFTEKIVCENGDTRHFEVRKMPIFDEYHQRQALVIIGRDITERIQSEQALLKAKEAAVAANQAKSEFLANMSHEIRTPMNAILGFSSILGDLVTDSVQRHYLQAIQTSGKTLLQLINDILDLSKIEAGKLELNYCCVDVKLIFSDISVIFMQKMAEKDITFSVNIADNIPSHLVLDEIRLRQVLLNIVGNAVKFTDHGFIRINVFTGSGFKEQYLDLVIEIEDSGMGIAQNQIEVIFSAFTQQAEQSVRYGGTGLGLTICKRLVKMMGGNIFVRSNLGKGSCFTIKLPKIEICHSVDSLIAEQVQTSQTVHFQPSKLLLVDDIEFNRELLKIYLCDYPEIEIVEAETGEQALALLAQQQFDLILMDRQLPGENGDLVCEKIRALPDYTETPIIMVSASVLMPFEQQQVFYNLQLNKPLNKTQLLKVMESFLPLTQNSTPKHQPEILQTAQSTANTKVLAEKLPELLSLLTANYQQRIADLNHSGVFEINEFTEIAEQLIQIAAEYNCALLADWAHALKNQAGLFDLAGLPKTLTGFDEVIRQLNSTNE